MLSFEDVFFTMMSFSTKKLKKTKFLAEEKNLQARNGLKSYLIMFFSDV